VEIGSSGILRSSGVKFLNRTSATDFKKPCSPFFIGSPRSLYINYIDLIESVNIRNQLKIKEFIQRIFMAYHQSGGRTSW
jgi:hypothetical protein